MNKYNQGWRENQHHDCYENDGKPLQTWIFLILVVCVVVMTVLGIRSIRLKMHEADKPAIVEPMGRVIS